MGTRSKRTKAVAFGKNGEKSPSPKLADLNENRPSKKIKLLDYETIREQNIREREKMFLELGLDQAKESVVPKTQPKKTPSRRGL